MDFSWLPEDNRYSTKPVDKLIDLIRDNRIESSAFIEEADENAVCVAFVFWLLFQGLWGYHGFVGSSKKIGLLSKRGTILVGL